MTAGVPRLLVIDISNSFTKFAIAHRGKLGRAGRIPTRELTAKNFREQIALAPLRHRGAQLRRPAPQRGDPASRAHADPGNQPSRIPLGIGIDYPEPASIGADRLVNAVACVALHGAPAIVVDFGTAVTFDVISKEGNYGRWSERARDSAR